MPGVRLMQSRHPVNAPLEGNPKDLTFGLYTFTFPPFPILDWKLLWGGMGAFYTVYQ